VHQDIYKLDNYVCQATTDIRMFQSRIQEEKKRINNIKSLIQSRKKLLHNANVHLTTQTIDPQRQAK